ncbi:MAG TPA: ribonuclease III, partial [Maritimibacter sp.]|nr:ribonuclease III [Maritimibacter sp.]
MKLSADLSAFAGRLGHSFQNPDLLIRALTHGSISTDTRPDNQRLEFLGDRVLGLVMAEALLAADKGASEGQLAPRFNALVRKETCADVAREVDLGAVLKLGRSEMMSGGRRKMALLGDGMEAVIAAVYLDGGFEAAKEMVIRLWGKRIDSVEADARDPKTALQEWAQARKMPP